MGYGLIFPLLAALDFPQIGQDVRWCPDDTGSGPGHGASSRIRLCRKWLMGGKRSLMAAQRNYKASSADWFAGKS